MTESTHARIPNHLRRYIVEQNYSRYTPEDQAVWRFIMRQLKSFLKVHAHESYVKGLELTGITVEEIPRIENIDKHLNSFGWGAVPVSGFTPPAAFMEFQSLGILPIASDMRTIDHLLYTPAPDIVHEAAGHAPILSDPEYAAYLLKYGDVARRSIISKEDMDQYEAIRVLSDIKEDPRSTEKEIALAESRLNEITKALTNVSEAALLSRMNWWTAEYGLIGDVKNPKIFGAGLLSSVGESRLCLGDKVKKIPLSVDCVNFSYDITEPQPQLFVAKDFEHLSEVLEDFAARLSFRRGGVFGLERAKEAKTVNTIELENGIQISGVLKHYFLTDDRDLRPIYLQFDGPSQIACNGQELEDQGIRRHPQGYSTPLGNLRMHQRPLSSFTQADLESIGLKTGEISRFQYESGIVVEGRPKDWKFNEGRLVLITWTDCKVSLGEKILFDPSWGEYDMVTGGQITSVFGGPADREKYGQTEDFANKRVGARTFTPAEREVHSFFQELRELRASSPSSGQNRWQKLRQRFLAEENLPWLVGVELVELSHQLGLNEDERRPLEIRLNSPDAADGLKIAAQKI